MAGNNKRRTSREVSDHDVQPNTGRLRVKDPLVALVYRCYLKGRRPMCLKDHQVRELINKVRDAVQPRFPKCQPLREVIAGAVIEYLDAQGLRADAKPRAAASV